MGRSRADNARVRLKRRLAMLLSAMIWALPFEARADSLDASFGFGVASLSGTGVGLILGTINAVMIAARSVEEPASRPLAIIGIVAAALAGLIAAIGMVVGS